MNRRMDVVELLGRIRNDGFGDTSRRVVRRIYDRLDAGALDFPLLPGDIADSTRVRPPARRARAGFGADTVGWICTPPSRGSGGHTTLFRMLAELESRGLVCTLYLYDRHGGSLERHTQVIRENWPTIQANVRDVRSGLEDADAYVASSWETAHVLATRPSTAGARLYFIQDFEPLFYPRGTLAALAEDSYRFGFTNIALGSMVASHLSALGVDRVEAPFGCDTDTYRLSAAATPRSGVVFYSRPGNDRRGYLLARRALELFATLHPEEAIHVYGDVTDDWAIPIVNHGKLTPGELAGLYNSCKAGFAMSFTNISLVAEEMLACGMIPVVNRSPLVETDLPNPHVRWAEATSGALCDALVEAVEQSENSDHRGKMARSVRRGWAPTSKIVGDTIAAAIAGV